MQIGLGAHDLIQGVVQGPQIRIDLALQVSRQEAQLLSGLDGGPGKDDPVHLSVLKCLDGHGHAQIRFSRSRRAHAEHDHLFPDQVDILLLSQGLGLYRLPVDGAADDILIDLQKGFILPLKGKGQGIIHILLSHLFSPF